MEERYDLELTQNSNKISLMLVVKDQEKGWRIEPAPLLPPTINIGGASSENLAPDREIQVGQSNWAKGFQEHIFSDPAKYRRGYNADTRFSNMVVAAGKIAPTAVTSELLVDGGLDIWTDSTHLTHWTCTSYVTRQGDGQIGRASCRERV